MTEVTDQVGAPAAAGFDLPPPRSQSVAPAESDDSRWPGIALLVGLLAWLAIAAGWEYLVVVFLLVFMIFMHEMGHYLAARWGGMKATEFFLGFGPKLWSFRRGETEYGIKAIWAGAYVKVIGMNNLDEVDPVDEPRTYRQASYPKRMLVAVAGSVMHFIMALITLYALLVTSGIDRDLTQWAVNGVSPDGAAISMGIEPGDKVVSGDGQTFETFDDMRIFVEPRAGQDVTITVEREGEILALNGTLGVSDDGERGLLGVSSSAGDSPFNDVGVFEAVPETFQTFGSFTQQTVVSIGDIFSPSGLVDFFSRVGDDDDAIAADGAVVADDNEGRILSLVGATRLGAQLTGQGLAGVLFFFFMINVFVGVFNLVPLLPLDGGHVVIGTYERLRSRGGRRYHADVAKALPLAYLVMIVLLSVGLVAVYLDIADPINL
jgi:membrane-associated protease RseP (regulator of RpoE activity)